MLHYGHGIEPATDPLDSSYISVTSVLLTPRSRGSVSLASKPAPHSTTGSISPENAVPDSHISTASAEVPKIIMNQMKEKLDKELMVKALEKAYEILQAPAWQEILEPQPTPGKEELLEIIQNRATTLWHLGGTCSMRTGETRGVVDNVFKVEGVRGLRVADVSVVPFPVVAHTQALAYLIGEKAAEFLLREHSDVI